MFPGSFSRILTLSELQNTSADLVRTWEWTETEFIALPVRSASYSSFGRILLCVYMCAHPCARDVKRMKMIPWCLNCSSLLWLFSRSVMSDSLWPRGLQHARIPCPSLSPEFAQVHVNQVGDAIQPSHPLSSTSSFAFSLSQHQGLFQWVSSPHQVANILELQLQHQSLQWIFRCSKTSHTFCLSIGLRC